MKNKTTMLAGISLLLCFCLLTGLGALAGRFGGGAVTLGAAEAISFLLPTVLLWRGYRQNGSPLAMRLDMKRLPKGALGFTAQIGITVAVLSLFLNFLIYQLAGLTGVDLTTTALNAPRGELSVAGNLLVIVVLSAIVEEVFLRGALLAAQEQAVGMGACLLASGVFFALLHGNLMNLAGPMIAGIAYAYLSFSFGSIWPAVLAHMVNNLYYLFIIWVTDTYAAFGIWKYFAPLNGLVLLLFLYLSLRSAEQLFAKGQIPHMEKGGGRRDIGKLLLSPVILAFFAAYVAKAVLHLL